MNKFDYIAAKDFDRAWLNFELDLPLKPGEKGQPNPFYVNRPGNPIAELMDALLAPFFRPPKFYFSGHRGVENQLNCCTFWQIQTSRESFGRSISVLEKRRISLIWIFGMFSWQLEVVCFAVTESLGGNYQISC